MRRVVVLLVLAAAVGMCAGCGSGSSSNDVAAGMMPTETTSYGDGYLLKSSMAAPAFSLTDQTGAKLGVQDEHGHWAVVTFMYTHCLDVCPLIANSLRAASAQLPDLRSLAISVDPKGDTPASVKKFLKAHRLPATFHYLTGTRAELAPVWKKYNVAATGGPRSTVSHSSFEILVDPKGRERIYFDAQIKAVDVIHDVKLLEQQG